VHDGLCGGRRKVNVPAKNTVNGKLPNTERNCARLVRKCAKDPLDRTKLRGVNFAYPMNRRDTVFLALPLLVLLLTAGCRTAKPKGDVGGGGLPSPEAVIATVKSLTGTPESGDGETWTRWTDLTVGYRIAAGTAILTGFNEELVLELPSGSVLTIAPGSWLTANITADGTPSFTMLKGNLSGFVEGGSVEFHNRCGGSIFLTPNAGARVPVSISDQPDMELRRLLGLGAPAWTYGDWAMSANDVNRPFIALRPFPQALGYVVPEPGTVALGITGAAALLWALRGQRRKG
jgi:hypothetical protein